MKKEDFIKRMETGETVVIARERCYMSSDLVTVPRKIVEALQDADKLTFSHKHNNFSKAYKMCD